MIVDDLSTMPYRQAWAHQEHVHAEVVDGAEERIILVEHPPVITCGRRPDTAKNLLASPEQLKMRDVEFVESDRGGDITFHGPGQLVVYPVVRLIDRGLSVGAYVRLLEQAVIDGLREFGVQAKKDACAVGVWVDNGSNALAKVGAVGVRVRRGVTMHGVALNVTTDLNYFDLIIPCGLERRAVTSLEKLLGSNTPTMEQVKSAVSRRLLGALALGHAKHRSGCSS